VDSMLSSANISPGGSSREEIDTLVIPTVDSMTTCRLAILLHFRCHGESEMSQSALWVE
jgi:hypothetical protein